MFPASFVPYILKLISPKLTESIAIHVAKAFKLPQLVNYMELPNDADIRIDKLEVQMEMVAEDQHPPIFTEEMKKELVNRLDKLEEFEKQVRRKKAFKRKDE